MSIFLFSFEATECCQRILWNRRNGLRPCSPTNSKGTTHPVPAQGCCKDTQWQSALCTTVGYTSALGEAEDDDSMAQIEGNLAYFLAIQK